MSEAAHAYAFGPIVEFNRIEQQILAETVTGELWKGFGAGPLVSAFGTEYREETLRNDVNSNLPARPASTSSRNTAIPSAATWKSPRLS